LSVVIPTFNEEARIIGTLSRVIEYLAAKDYQWEIVVADDGSIDQPRIWLNWRLPSIPIYGSCIFLTGVKVGQ